MRGRVRTVGERGVALELAHDEVLRGVHRRRALDLRRRGGTRPHPRSYDKAYGADAYEGWGGQRNGAHHLGEAGQAGLAEFDVRRLPLRAAPAGGPAAPGDVPRHGAEAGPCTGGHRGALRARGPPTNGTGSSARRAAQLSACSEGSTQRLSG
jgi:hypothetical protein